MSQSSTSSRPFSDGGATNSLSTTTDQNGGDLHSFINRLVPLCPAHAASMPVSRLLSHLMKAAPAVFLEVDRLSEMARVVSGLNDDMATQWKLKGNREFAAQQFEHSVSTYTQGLLCAQKDETVAILLNNRSTALFHLHNYAGACMDANRALMYKPHYWKAMQRRGRALEELGLHDLARRDIDAASAESVEQANDADTMHGIFVQAELLPKRADRLAGTRTSHCENTSDDKGHDAATPAPAKTDDTDGASHDKSTCDDEDELHALLSPAAALHVQCTEPEQGDGGLARSVVASKAIALDAAAMTGATPPFPHDGETDELHDSLICETPYAMVARAEALLSVCAHCLRPTLCLYHGDDYRAAGCKSRGLFCSESCARASWCRDGAVESRHVFHLCCPNDALLACRIVRAGKEGRAVRLMGELEEVSAFAAAAMQCGGTNKKHTSQAGTKEDGSAGAKEQRRAAVLDAAFVRTLRHDASRELSADPTHSLSCASPASTTEPNESGAHDTHHHQGHPSSEAAMTSGGCESVVTALGLYMGAYDADTAEHIRTAHRLILSNAIPLTFTLRSALSSMSATTNTSTTCAQAKVSTSVMHKDTVVTAGKGLYVVAALLNHSCDPNCFLSVLHNPQGCSSRVVVRAIRPIAAGEELTIAYDAAVTKYKLHSVSLRRRALCERYGFTCRCRLCRSESADVDGGNSRPGATEPPMTPTMRAHYVRAADMYQKGLRLLRERDYATAVTVLLQSYDMVMRFICPPPRPPQPMLLKVHGALARAYMHMGQKEKCYEHLRAELDMDVAIHGTDNQSEMIHAYTRLAMVAPDVESKRAHAEKAVGLLKRYYAPSPMRHLQVLHIRACGRAATPGDGGH